MTSPAMRARYLSESVSTASPSRLLVMLCDRLQLDLAQAETSLREGNRLAASPRLMHAQEIVLELRGSLDVNSWEGAPALADLYGYLVTELIQANVKADPDRVADCRQVVEPLCDAWREAAMSVAPGK